ncbi:MAG TPA: hypothetical protein VG893_11085 [Terracidiphilus sp.]|nr:hypothetical protein [Terracidiphilus sp.]
MFAYRAASLAAAFGLCSLSLAAQAPAPAAAPAPLTGPSTVLQPALDSVRATLGTIKVDKWKRGSVRDEAGQDIGSIVSDMQINLPPLLRDADTAPALVSKQIAVARNVDALYDVLLRVVEASRISAPDDQAGTLIEALNTLSKARLALYDKMNDAAALQEKQAVELRATVQKQAEFKCPAPPPPPPCPAAKHHTTRKRSSAAKAPAKPAASTPAAKTPPKPQ